MWNLEYWALESWILLKETRIPLRIAIQNPRSTDKDWNEVLVIRVHGVESRTYECLGFPYKGRNDGKRFSITSLPSQSCFFFLWNSPAETLTLLLLLTPRQPPLCWLWVQELTGLTLPSPKWNLNSDEKQFSITILPSQSCFSFSFSNSPAETLTWPLLF